MQPIYSYKQKWCIHAIQANAYKCGLNIDKFMEQYLFEKGLYIWFT